MQKLTGSEFDLQFGPVIDVRNVDVSNGRTGLSVTIHKTEENDQLSLTTLAILKYIMLFQLSGTCSAYINIGQWSGQGPI